MSDTLPKRTRNSNYAATRAGYAPSLAYRTTSSAPTPSEEEKVSGDSRVSAHPTIPGNVLRFSGCRRGGHRSESHRGRVIRPSGRVVGVPVHLGASVEHIVLTQRLVPTFYATDRARSRKRTKSRCVLAHDTCNVHFQHATRPMKLTQVFAVLRNA